MTRNFIKVESEPLLNSELWIHNLTRRTLLLTITSIFVLIMTTTSFIVLLNKLKIETAHPITHASYNLIENKYYYS